MATALDIEFLSQELETAQLPNFVLLSTPPVDLELVDEKDDADMDATFSCGLLDYINIPHDTNLTGEAEIRVLIDKQLVELESQGEAGEREPTLGSLPLTISSSESLVLPHDLESSWGRVLIPSLLFSAFLGAMRDLPHPSLSRRGHHLPCPGG